MNDNIGIFPGVSFEEYAKIDALNGSSLLHMRKSPMHYRYMADNPQPPTEAMILGTATHRMILEPERVGDLATWGGREEEKVRRGKVWDDFLAVHAGKMIVTVKERDAMVGMAVGARNNAPIMKYAGAKGDCEVTMVWTDTKTGLKFKGRIDKLIKAGPTIFDLKTTRSCQKYKFGGQAYTLGYHIKMALYWQGYKNLTGDLPTLVLGAIENTAPHESAVYRITSDALLQGLEDLGAILAKRQQCIALDEWPAAEPEEAELTLPTYAYPQADDDLSELELVKE